MIFILLIAILASVDLIAKSEIERQEDESFPRELKGRGGRLLLYRKHNPGLPMEFMKERPELVRMIPLAMASFLGGMLARLLRGRGNRAEKLALSLALSGAVSNLVDRWKRGYVVDYLCVPLGFLKKIIFNLGDLFIFAGSAIYLLCEILRDLRNYR